MGMVHAIQKGEMSPSKSGQAAQVAETMKPSDVTEFAETKTTGLPEKRPQPRGKPGRNQSRVRHMNTSLIKRKF